MENLFFIRYTFDEYGIQKKVNIFVIFILYKQSFFSEFSMRAFRSFYNVIGGQSIFW